ncbi:MAG: hypothetical protein ACREOZ_00705, partial [Gloeomargaritales cyanobacterium]
QRADLVADVDDVHLGANYRLHNESPVDAFSEFSVCDLSLRHCAHNYSIRPITLTSRSPPFHAIERVGIGVHLHMRRFRFYCSSFALRCLQNVYFMFFSNSRRLLSNHGT